MKKPFCLLLALLICLSTPALAGTSFRLTPADAAETPTPEPTLEPTAEPTLEPTASPAPDPWREAVSALLSDLAREEEDPWRLAVYEAGTRDIALDGEQLRLSLRSFNPGLERLGRYEDDRDAYLEGLLQNACAYDLELLLPVEGGALADGSAATVRKAVQSAATASKAAFDQKAVRVAIAEWLFPAPDGDADRYKACIDRLGADAPGDPEPPSWAPLFQAQCKQVLSVAGGPHALALNCSGVDPENLLDGARSDALYAFAKRELANPSEKDDVRDALIAHLSERAAQLAKKPDEDFALSLDVDALALGELPADYVKYVDRYALSRTVDNLYNQVRYLPDYAALDLPQSGRLSGSTKGTKVILRLPADADPTYIQMRSADGDEMVVSGFIRPGGSCTVRVRKGRYCILTASGEIWYGEDNLFGYSGDYGRTEDFEVKGSNYYHTIDLGVDEDGNMNVYGAFPSDFR